MSATLSLHHPVLQWKKATQTLCASMRQQHTTHTCYVRRRSPMRLRERWAKKQSPSMLTESRIFYPLLLHFFWPLFKRTSHCHCNKRQHHDNLYHTTIPPPAAASSSPPTETTAATSSRRHSARATPRDPRGPESTALNTSYTRAFISGAGAHI